MANHQMKDWEIIADNLSKAGWSLGCISSTNHEGRQFCVVAAERKDAGRFIVQPDEKLTAFLELESAIRVTANWLDKPAGFSPDSASLNGSESGGGLSPRQVLRLFRTRHRRINAAGKRKEEL